MGFWETVKSDLEKGIKEGMEIVKGGAIFVREKAEKFTEEGKRQLKLFELKSKVKKDMEELGGHIYDLKSKVKNPMLDRRVKSVIARIKKLEDQIANLEGKTKEAIKKIPAKIKSRKRKVIKKKISE